MGINMARRPSLSGPTKAIDGLSQNGNSMFSITVPYKYYFMF